MILIYGAARFIAVLIMAGLIIQSRHFGHAGDYNNSAISALAALVVVTALLGLAKIRDHSA
jgi:hypothetical protein